jgi:TonB-linked SusC/RagA family outer membrane protein
MKLLTDGQGKAVRWSVGVNTGQRPSKALEQLIRIMKLTCVLLTVAFLHVSAGSYSQQVTLSLKDVPIEKVFREIERQTGYGFLYNKKMFADFPNVTIEAKNEDIKAVLDQCFRAMPVDYVINSQTIVIREKTTPEKETPMPTALPPGEVHGKVVDSVGMPLEGVNVQLKGTKRGTVTGKNGEFVIKDIPSDGELVVSIVGYEAQVVSLRGRQDITVALRQSMSKLDETVVKGYYNTTERLNTGDVTTVKGEQIQEQPVSDPILALEGRVPGLYIQQTSGVPGAYSTIQIRGQNSIANGNDPLYIVDGVPYSSVSLTNPSIAGGAAGEPNGALISNVNGGGLSPFNNLNPADIESIVVLKDADATAIYGSRGANGVILITSKKGKAGKTKFDLTAYSGGGKVTRTLDLLNTQQYLAMLREAFSNDGLALPSINTNPSDYNYDIDGLWDTTRYTNWQKTLIGNVANFTNLQGHLSGGNTNTQFIIGAGYSKQGTVYIGNSYDQKISANINLNHTSDNQRFHAQMSASFINGDNNLPNTDLTSQVTLAPDAPALYDRNGNVNWEVFNGSATFSNPILISLRTMTSVTDNLISNLNLGYRLVDAVWLRCSLGYNRSQMNQTYLIPGSSYSPPYNANPIFRTNEEATSNAKSWIVEPQLDFKKQIAKGQLAILIGSTFQERDRSNIAQDYYGFAEDALISNPAAASSVRLLGDNYTEYRYDALYGRIGYNWQEKYLFNLTARRDGSSRFGPGKQFGNFGAIGAGWIFSKERWIENMLPGLSFGKLRASYGVTGNDQITDYQYLSTYTPNSQTYEGLTGLSPTRLANPYFAWEIVKKLEGGIELGFLKDRVLTTISVYRDRSGNQLVGYPLPYTTGFTSIQSNLPALVQNSGVELTLNTINIKTQKVVWTTSFNMTIPSNRLVAFPNLANSSYAGVYVVGKSIFSQQLFQATGVNPQTGLYSFRTKNANGLPSYPQDIVTTKPITQKFYGGIQNSVSYKGFQLDFLLQFVNQIEYNYQVYIGSPGQFNSNEPTAVLSRWQKPEQVTNIQRFGTNSATTTNYSYLTTSTGILTDGSFVRLKNLALSYQFPSKWLNSAHLQNARMYLQCQNLWTWTKYLGLDPETGGLNLPPLRMITGGIQIGL